MLVDTNSADRGSRISGLHDAQSSPLGYFFVKVLSQPLLVTESIVTPEMGGLP